jgi:hypothetical protein
MEPDNRNRQTIEDFTDAKLTNHRKLALPLSSNTRALCAMSGVLQKSSRHRLILLPIYKCSAGLRCLVDCYIVVLAPLPHGVVDGAHLPVKLRARGAGPEVHTQGDTVRHRQWAVCLRHHQGDGFFAGASEPHHLSFIH